MRDSLTLFLAAVIALPGCSGVKEESASRSVPQTGGYDLTSNQKEVIIFGVPCSIGTHILRIGATSARLLAKHVDSNGTMDEVGGFFVREHLTSNELPEHNEQHHYGFDVIPDDMPNSVTVEAKELQGPTYRSKPLFVRMVTIGKNGYFVNPISAHGDIRSPGQIIYSVVYNSEKPMTDMDKNDLGFPFEKEAQEFCRTKKCEMIFFVFAGQKPKN